MCVFFKFLDCRRASFCVGIHYISGGIWLDWSFLVDGCLQCCW